MEGTASVLYYIDINGSTSSIGSINSYGRTGGMSSTGITGNIGSTDVALVALVA